MLEVTSADIGKECPLCHGSGNQSRSTPCPKCKGSGRIGVQETPVVSKEEQNRLRLERQRKLQEDYDADE